MQPPKDQLNTRFCFHLTCVVLLISEARIYNSQPGVRTMFHFGFLHRHGFFTKKEEYFHIFQDFSQNLRLVSKPVPQAETCACSSIRNTRYDNVD